MDISTDKMYAKMLKQTTEFAAKRARMANYIRIIQQQLALKNGLVLPTPTPQQKCTPLKN
jgi:hypothetical protein